MELKRVVVTGLGALTPIGNTVSEYWNGLVSGKSGANNITYFDASNFKRGICFDRPISNLGVPSKILKSSFL